MFNQLQYFIHNNKLIVSSLSYLKNQFIIIGSCLFNITKLISINKFICDYEFF